MVQPVLGPNDREPDLITHHTHNGTGPDDFDYDDPYTGEQQAAFNEYGDDAYDDGPGDEPLLDENGKKIKPILTPLQRKKRRWRRVRRTLYVLFGLFVIVPAVGFAVLYFTVDVPSPQSVIAAQSQPITYYYSDGSVMGKDSSGGNRQVLQPNQIPPMVEHAVTSTEDATFETNSGFDFTGILRAVYNQATGGVGGGSTISQQYIKQATKNDDPTLSRKATELVKSFKMNQTYSKQDIITGYLNIIYFGRGAYGIQAASQAFYHKDASQLDASEAALLAGLIQQPARSENPTVAHERWNTAMDRMVKNGYITQAARAAATFPAVIPLEQSKEQQAGGALDLHIQDRVDTELSNLGYDSDKLHQGGYKIYTTIDPKAQAEAVQAVQDKMKGQTDTRILNALVAVSPQTGGVVAYYGGPSMTTNAAGNPIKAHDRADQPRNPGSSIKPFDLTAFLKMGKGLGETFDGTSPRSFPGVPKPIKNAGVKDSCSKECTVATAMERSTNTVFYDMVYNVVGYPKVGQAAIDAGIKTKAQGGTSVMGADNNIALGGGSTVATPADMAAAYATFAGGGQRHDAHFVAKLTNSQDEVAYTAPAAGTPAFASDPALSAQIAGNVTTALEPVIAFSNLVCPPNHECAGKTGTQQYDMQPDSQKSWADDNAQTWMVGYTNSISVAAWVGGDGNVPLHDQNGKALLGATLAGPIWSDFMDAYLKDKPAEKFPQVDPIGKPPTIESTTTPPTTPSTTPSTTSSSETTSSTTSSDTTSSTTSSDTTTSRTDRPGPPFGGGNPPGGGGAPPGLLPNDPAR